MRGIDVSHWQSGFDLKHAKSAECEFVIVKASQGTTYRDSCRSKFLIQAANLDMLIGAYHFAGGYNPEMEAKHFWQTVKGLNGKAMFVLDYEIQCDTDIYGSNRKWIERFINKFYQLSGKYCMIYIDSRYLSQLKASFVVDKCPLWLARYTKPYKTFTNDSPPNFSPWRKLTIWQFTSKLRIPGFSDDLDGDIAYITRDEWIKLAGGKTAQPANEQTAKKPTGQIIGNIVSGKYGTGLKRRKALTDLGYNPDECQKLVNEYYQIANKVIKGKYGNGKTRKQNIEKLGYNYAVVQQIVNILVR